MLSLTDRSTWKINPGVRIAITLICRDSLILPQALAAHLLIISGEDPITDKKAYSHFWSLIDNVKSIGITWSDRLQSSIFAIASYEAGTKTILKAMDLASEFERSHGIQPTNYANWGYIQGFLWHAFNPPEKCRPVMKLIYTVMAVMKEVADDFPDDLSPMQKITF